MTAPRTWTTWVCERKECGPISHRDVAHPSDGEPYHRWTRCLASVEEVEVIEASAYHLVVAERDRLKEALRDESYNRASAARAAQRYAKALEPFVQAYEDVEFEFAPDHVPLSAFDVARAALSSTGEAPSSVSMSTEEENDGP